AGLVEPILRRGAHQRNVPGTAVARCRAIVVARGFRCRLSRGTTRNLPSHHSRTGSNRASRGKTVRYRCGNAAKRTSPPQIGAGPERRLALITPPDDAVAPSLVPPADARAPSLAPVSTWLATLLVPVVGIAAPRLAPLSADAALPLALAAGEGESTIAPGESS